MMMSSRLGMASNVTFYGFLHGGAAGYRIFMLFGVNESHTMEPTPISMPGMYPAMNRVDMDTPPATVEYTMNAL